MTCIPIPRGDLCVAPRVVEIERWLVEVHPYCGPILVGKRGEERLQQYRKGREERDDIRVERRQIEKLAKRLTTYLEENTDKKHIPEALKKPIALAAKASEKPVGERPKVPV